MKLATKMLLLLILSSLWAIFPQAIAHQEQANKGASDQINVTGIGEVEAEPDQAVLSISISVTKPTLVQAKKDADDKYRQVLDVIEEANIPKQQYKVTSLNSYPQYDWNVNKRSEYKGQKITRLLSIIINDLEKLSSVMQALVENGASTITSVSPGFQDESGLQRQALEKAIDDARSKAAFIAQKLNRDLGEVLNISEQNAQSPVFQSRTVQLDGLISRASSNSISTPPEAFGTQKVQANINASFKLN